MEIKLKPSQLNLLTQIQNKKAELNQLMNELNEKEKIILEVLFEEKEVIGSISNMSLDGGTLKFDVELPKEEKKKEAKVKKLKATT